MARRSEEKLHRLQNNKNDWDNISPDKLNRWQRVAKASRGILTIGNTITIASTALVINGLADFANGQKMSGLLKVMGGRAGDLADGAAADATGTKGRIGRDLDPSVDAIQLLAAAPVLEHAGYLPLAPAVAMIGSKGLDIAGSLAARSRGRELNPAEEGKLGAFALWGGIGCFMLKGALDRHLPGAVDTALEIAGWTGTVGGTIYKLPATAEYLRGGFGITPTEIPTTNPAEIES